MEDETKVEGTEETTEDETTEEQNELDVKQIVDTELKAKVDELTSKVNEHLTDLNERSKSQKTVIVTPGDTKGETKDVEVKPAAPAYIQKALERGLVQERQLESKKVYWGQHSTVAPLVFDGNAKSTRAESFVPPVSGYGDLLNNKRYEYTAEEKAYFALIGEWAIACATHDREKQLECARAVADTAEQSMSKAEFRNANDYVLKELASGFGVGSLWVYFENLETYQRLEDEATYWTIFRQIPVSQATGNIDWETALFTFEWVDEGGAKPEVEPDGTSLDWELHKYAGICAVTDELLADSVINLGAYIVEVAARSRNQWIWQHVAVGTGVGQPTGLGAIAFLGTNTIAQAGAALQETDVKAVNRAVIQNYRNRNVWICNDACLTLICNLMDAAGGALGTGSFLWRVFDDGVNPRPFGRPIYVNNFLPAGATSPGQGVSNLYFIDPYNFVFFRKPGEGFKVSYSEDATVVFGSKTIRAFQDNYKLWRFEERYDHNMIDRNSSSVLTNVHA